jgi:phosphatidylglycerol:prolipoprotein diacylglycerol transferase
MIPVFFHLGPIPIYSYGVMAACGFIAASLLLASECRRRGLNPAMADSLVVFAAIGGFAAARVYDVFDNWAQYAAHPVSIVFSGSGFVWYGGFVGGIISTWLVARYYGVSFLTVTDMCAAPLVLGQAFGRMGCQLSGDGDWGLPSTVPWAMAYPKAIVGWHGDLHLPDGAFIPATVLKLNSHGQLVDGFFPGVRVHPTPLYEVILYLAIFALLWSMRKRARFDGELVVLYLILAGAARFVVEFWRINPRVFAGLSEAQIVSGVMMIAGTIGWFCLPRPRTVETRAMASA